jgi:hypothetical protein
MILALQLAASTKKRKFEISLKLVESIIFFKPETDVIFFKPETEIIFLTGKGCDFR